VIGIRQPLEQTVYDLAVVGRRVRRAWRPQVYGASEGLRTVVLEQNSAWGASRQQHANRKTTSASRPA